MKNELEDVFDATFHGVNVYKEYISNELATCMDQMNCPAIHVVNYCQL